MTFKGTLLCSLVLSHFALSAGAGYTAEILIAPETQIALPGTTVMFNCHTYGDGYWVINGSNVIANRPDFPGFEISRVQLSAWNEIPQFNLSITVDVSMGNNDTRIECVGFGNINTAVSDTALLIAAGPPSVPTPTVSLPNATTIQLTWPVPFTHCGYGVDHYTVTIEDQTTVEESILDGNITNFMYAKAGGIAQDCDELQFTVTATNSVGESNGAAVITGFPTVPPALPMTITADVSFRIDATPTVKVRFELPEICAFQTSEYTIVVEQKNSTEHPMVFGPTSFTSSDPVSVEKDVSSGLERDLQYIVSVYVESLAGRSPTTTTHFNTTLVIPTDPEPTGDTTLAISTGTEPTGENGEVNGTTAVESDKSSADDSTLLIVTGASAGVAATLLLTLGVIATFCVVHRRTSGERKPEEGKKLPPMVTNPHYEASTPVYESIEDPPWKALLKRVDEPMGSSKDPRYFNVPPQLPSSPPPRKPATEFEPETKACDNIRAKFCSSTRGTQAGDECYTTMNPVGTLSRQNSQVPTPVPGAGDEYVMIASRSGHKN